MAANIFYDPYLTKITATSSPIDYIALINTKLGHSGAQVLNGSLNLTGNLNLPGIDNSIDGILHLSSTGVTTNSLIVNANVSDGTIADGKLASSISTTATNNSIVKRDGSAGITVGAIASKSIAISADGANNVGGQLNITSASDPNKSFWLGVDNSANGFIQAFQQSVGVKPLQLNPNGGSVVTLNNTLDNGSGALTTIGSIITNGESSAIGADANSANLRLGFVKKSGANPRLTTNSSLPIVFSSLNQASLTSAAISSGTLTSLWSMGVNGSLTGINNTLDDGFGNMSVNGNTNSSLTINNSGSVVVQTELKIAAATKAYYGYDTTNGVRIMNGNGIAILKQTGSQTYNTTLSSANNILDDGSGNLTTAGAITASQDLNNLYLGQLIAAGRSTPTQNLILGYNTTGDYGYIQAIYQSVGLRTLKLNALGGSVVTQNSTLDDGSGFLTALSILGVNGVSCGQVGGNPANAKNLTMSYDIGNDWGVIEAIHQNSSYKPIHISPNGGATVCGGDISSVGTITPGKAIFQKSTTVLNGTTQTLDNSAYLWIFTGTSTMTATLPLANAYGASATITYMIVNNHSVGNVTINCAGSDTLDDGSTTTHVLTGRYSKIQLQSDGVSQYYTV
jgi:hypothetical protein